MRGLVLAGLALAACGTEILRPLAIDVLGLSARAESFVLKIVPGDQLPCASVGIGSVGALEAPYQSRWVRSENQPRRANLPTLEVEVLTVIAYSEDAAGTTIQYACRQLSFEDIADLPFGVLELTLTRRQE